MINKPKHRQQWILEELKKSPLKHYVEMWAMYRLKWAKGKTTFDKDWKRAKEEHEAYQEKVQKEKERVSITTEVEAVKRGLKTKVDRLFILQGLVDNCLKDLSKGMTNDVIVFKGAPKQYRRKMTITEYNQTRKTLKDLQAEISKMEGDYAKNEIEITQIRGSVPVEMWLNSNTIEDDKDKGTEAI